VTPEAEASRWTAGEVVVDVVAVRGLDSKRNDCGGSRLSPASRVRACEVSAIDSNCTVGSPATDGPSGSSADAASIAVGDEGINGSTPRIGRSVGAGPEYTVGSFAFAGCGASRRSIGVGAFGDVLRSSGPSVASVEAVPPTGTVGEVGAVDSRR
jgi:hypothetical protein